MRKEVKGVRGIFEKDKFSGIWWIRYADANGKIRRELAGSKSVARDLYIKRKAEVRDGRKLPDNLRGRKILFAELADDALRYVAEHNEGHAVDTMRIEQFKKAFGQRPADITIEALRDWFAEHDWKPGTYNRCRTVLSSIFKLGMENKKIASNPAKLLKRKRESDGRVRFLNQNEPDEEARLREVITQQWPEHLAEFEIAVNTGMRRSEQYRRITWECVDFGRRDLFVPKSKNGRARHIALNDAALAAFRELYQRTGGSNPIFAGKAGIALQGPRHWFEDAIEKAKVPDFTWHDCRHTFASRLVMRGVPLRVVAELLGHRTIQMTMRYAHLADADKLAAVRELDTFNGEATGVQTDTKTDTNRKRRVSVSPISAVR